MRKLVTLFLCIASLYLKAQVTDVVTSLYYPTSIAISGNEMYIAEDDKITKIDLTDANPTPVDFFTDFSDGAHLLIDGNDLYIGLYAGGKVIKMDISVDDPTPVDVVTNVYGTNGLALKGDFLYIAESTQDKISRVDLSEATPTATDFITNLGFPNALFIDGDDLYFIEVDHDRIVKADLTQTNSSPTTVVSGLDTPSLGLILIEDELYFSQYGGDKISKFNINDINPTVVDVVTDLNGPAGLLQQGDDLYIAVRFDNKIVKVDNTTLSIVDSNQPVTTEIVAYPNPILNTISIQGLQKPQTGKLLSSTGKKVKDFIAEENTVLDLQNLQSGIYYVVLENGWTQKVIKK